MPAKKQTKQNVMPLAGEKRLTTSRVHWRRFVLLFAVLLVVLSVVSAALGTYRKNAQEEDSTAPSYATGERGAAVDGKSVVDSSTSSTNDTDVVKTGTVTLSVTDPVAAVKSAQLVAESLKGRIDSSNMTDETSCGPITYGMEKMIASDSVYVPCNSYAAWFVLRVPVASLDTAKDSLRNLDENKEFDSETMSTVDATRQVSDYEAQLSTLKTEETALQGLLAKATELSDILTIREQLTKVRAEIESLQSQLVSLQDQVNYATLTVYLKKIGQETKDDSLSARFSNAFASLRANVSSFGTFLVYVVVYAIVWIPLLVMVFVLGWLVRRFVRRHWRSL